MRARFRSLWVVGSCLISCALVNRNQVSRDESWLAQAQRQIAEREYRASENGEGLQAPNRAHNLRTYFDKTGIRVHDRAAGGSPELVALSLAAMGRGDSLAEVNAGEDVSAHENRVEITRPDLVEWYVNSEAGLEQGFTLERRPVGDGPLIVELAVTGAHPAPRGNAIDFETGAQRKLSYGKLAASDAASRSLAAHFDVIDSRLQIVVDDADATYPVSIDPVLTGTADAQLESNQTNAQLGASVASAGDVNGDGYADVIVGAPFYDAGQPDEGAAFVFLGGASGIASANPSTVGVAQLESNQLNALFGTSVAAAGDVNGDGYADIIVGANLYDAGQTNEGAAFVFLGSASGIASGNPLTAAARLEGNAASAQLGFSVAGAGDVNGDGYADVIVGAPTYVGEGAAFVFLGSASGIANGNPFTAATQLVSNQASVQLGWSVAGAGDVNGDGYSDVIVGAPLYDDFPADEGAAFVFLGSASGIASGSQTAAAARLESDQANSGFGRSVAVSGDVNGDGYADVIVGAPSYDSGQMDEGAAFIFLGSGSGIANGNPTTPGVARLESDQASALFGYSVAGAGDVNGDGFSDVIAGAPFYPGSNGQGAAFVFLGSASGIASGNPATAAGHVESDQASAQLGWSVAGAGDVNGDGYAEVIVGAPTYDAPETDEGAAFVYLGGGRGIASGDAASAATQLQSNQASASLGLDVASAGDVNGDGYADVIVGAPFYDAGQTDEGAAFVFLGSASGIASGDQTTAAALVESNQASANFGHSVAGAGDVNGDGYADVIVGAPTYDAGETDEGAAFVFLGSASGIASGNPATAATTLAVHLSSVAGAGDVNGDGYADVIVGDPTAGQPGQPLEGAAFVFLGNHEGRPVLARQRRGDGSGRAVQPWGLSQSTTGFAAELLASHAQGTGRVKAQLQACPPGVPFGNGSCTNVLTSSWVTVNGATPEVMLSQTFTGLTNHTLYRWRARVLHAAATGPIPTNPSHTPWRRLGAQSVEADIRLPEPSFCLSLACCLTLLAALAARRRADAA